MTNKAIIGKKLGMTQIFTEDGDVIPVTVIEAGPCPVVQKKTVDNDGYEALQVAFDPAREKSVNKPIAGHYKKANVTPRKVLRELKLDDAANYEVGQELKCDMFSVGDHVDVVGTSKGHGFTGVIKRWNQHIGPKAHGSGCHRVVGSMGANSYPSRVFKNKHMSGQWGNERVTVQNLTVARVDAERNLILVKGGIPGAKGSYVVVKTSVKAK